MTAMLLTSIAIMMMAMGFVFVRGTTAFMKLDEVRHDRKCDEYPC